MSATPKSNLFFSFVTTLLLALALTTVFKARQVLIWKLSILATEFGHWFVLISLMLAALAWITTNSGGLKHNVMIALMLISAILFARPVAQAYMGENRWASYLEHTFGFSAPSSMLSFSQLWIGDNEKPVVPEYHTYATTPTEQKFIFYRAASSKPTPWVLVIHGGGWDSGNPSQLPELNSHLARRGYSVAAISYRLAPTWKWRAQKEDAFAAVDYIKAHATELNIDHNNWVVLGRSAGGQIAQSVAYQKHDPSLKGLIAYYSPADMDFAYRYAKDKDIINSKDLLVNFLGATPDQAPSVYKDASPIDSVNVDSPPTLLLHGTPDPLTWCVQSRRLYDKMTKAGRPIVYIELPWATHAFDFSLNGPSGQIATSAVDLFLKAVTSSSSTEKGEKHVL